MKYLKLALLITGFALSFLCLDNDNFIFSNVLGEGKIVVVESDKIKPYDMALEGFEETFRGKIYKKYNMMSDLDKGQEIAKEIKSAKPYMVLAIGAQAAFVLSKDIKDIPIIFCMISDPEKYDIKGNNITGVVLDIPVSTQLEGLKGIFPQLRNIGVVYSSPEVGELLSDSRAVSDSLGLRIISEKITDISEIPDTLDSLLPQIDLLWLLFDPIVYSSKRVISDWILLPALKSRVPIVGFNKWSVTEGAFMCFYSNYKEIGQQTGAIANEVLQGRIPKAIEIAYPHSIAILINYNTLKRISEKKIEIKIPKNAYVYGES